ncbi:lanthionine synthetase LanC family protein [Taibaiella soli]|uniref:Lanthionine synthetase n=1 Tax=Taibaiella soli TaxID=1649169 RepID=A0A2W2B300_9BACT|nr:lanthionine synthetase LanC family protein [Taibaiella soli]PZF74428.1 hypothetical protein DN068_02285 [Taibaiella soli]
MTENIRQILAHINADLDAHPLTGAALIGDGGGMVLFKTLYATHFNTEYEKFEQDINDLVQYSFDSPSPNFCYGKAGVHWLFHFLCHRLDLIDEAQLADICIDHEALAGLCLYEMARGNYDALFGAIGVARGLVFPSVEGKETLNEKILTTLLANNDGVSNMSCSFDFKTYVQEPDIVDLGLAHGLASILKYSLECYTANIATDKARMLAANIVTFLKSQVNTAGKYTFGYEVVAGEPLKNGGRLAWCYSDLSTAYILLQYGRLFHDEEITNWAVTIIRQCSEMTASDDTTLKDACFCHGSAGIAYLFMKANQIHPCTEFKNAADYWIGQTVAAAVPGEGLGGYTMYTKEDGFIAKPSLLEGSTGVGLVLLSYLTGDYSWDYCVMLQ